MCGELPGWRVDSKSDLNSNTNGYIRKQCDQKLGVVSKVDGEEMKNSWSKVDGGMKEPRSKADKGINVRT